jgi:hypothetical protein
MRAKRLLLVLAAMLAFGIAAANNSFTIKGGSPTFFLVTYETTFTQFIGADISYGVTTGFDDGFGIKPYLLMSGGGQWSNWWIEFSIPKGVIPIVGFDNTWFMFGYHFRW